MAIITYPLNGIDYTADDAETYLCTRVSGVFASDGHFDASVTGDREITIGTGLAWIQNADRCGKSVYNDAPAAVTVPIADGTWDRIDRIVLRFSKEGNASEIAVKEGNPSSTPKAPDVTRTETTYELGLYTVEVAASSVAVSAAAITDTRMDEDVCGLMRDGVTGIPTAQLQAQAEELIENLKEEIASIEGGSEVMLKATYDPADGERQVAFKDDLDEKVEAVNAAITELNSAIDALNDALTDGSVTKVGTSTVGSGTNPIYLSSGTPTASSSTVGSGTKPVYLSSGTITATASTTSNSWYIRNGWAWRAFNSVEVSSFSIPSSSYYPVSSFYTPVIIGYSDGYYMGAVHITSGGTSSVVYYKSYAAASSSAPSSAKIYGIVVYRYS